MFRWLRKALRLGGPNTLDPFERAYAEGCWLFGRGQPEAAIDSLLRASTLRPPDFRPWEMIGCSLGMLAQWEDAVNAFEIARQLGHECHQCWYNRAQSLCQLQRAEEALAALDRSLELEPANPAAWYDRGLILGLGHGRAAGQVELFDGRHDRAVEAFDRALALEPGHAGAWYGRAYVLYKISHGRTLIHGAPDAGSPGELAQQGLACVERALALRPGWPEAEQLRGEIRAWAANLG